jgi:hypothetical protein
MGSTYNKIPVVVDAILQATSKQNGRVVGVCHYRSGIYVESLPGNDAESCASPILAFLAFQAATRSYR